MRSIGRPRAFVHANRSEAARLKYPHQFQPNHLQQREERDDEAAAVVRVGKELVEPARLGFRETRKQLLDARFD